MQTRGYRAITRGDWQATLLRLGLWILALGLSSVVWLPTYWYLWLLVVVGGLGWLVHWHAHQFAYRCAHCDHEFEVAPWLDLVSPQGFTRQGDGWKFLRCPQCHQWSRATVLSTQEHREEKGML